LAIACVVAGVLLALGALSLPAHLRATDARLVRAAGDNGESVRKMILDFANQGHVGAGELLRQAGRRQNLPDAGNFYRQSFVIDIEPPIADVFIHNRERDIELVRLQQSNIPAITELLQTRALNNTKLFAPSSSAAGQAFDTAVAIAACLIQQGSISEPLRNAMQAAAKTANQGGDTQPLENMLLDFLSLGERFNRDQAGAFVKNIQDPAVFSLLTEQARTAGTSLPTLYAAVILSGQPEAVAAFVRDHNDTALVDVATSLHFGAGGVKELLRRQFQLVGAPSPRESALARAVDNFCLTAPVFALTLKCLLFVLGGFFLAEAAHYARPQPSELERPLEVRGAHVARGSLFAVGFLVVAVLLSEPYLAQQGQKMEIRLHLPTVGSASPAGAAPAKPLTTMNSSNTTLLTLLLFFVLQALLYVACLVKLAEIKRQPATPRVKLKLLENEEHLFDAGLYLGFCGTIVSLILASLGVTGWSLMAAYSSTSFGIIFVSIFKIFHLRSCRRELLLLSEDDRLNVEAEAMRPMATMP
jgi:hypothetical protein